VIDRAMFIVLLHVKPLLKQQFHSIVKFQVAYSGKFENCVLHSAWCNCVLHSAWCNKLRSSHEKCCWKFCTLEFCFHYAENVLFATNVMFCHPHTWFISDHHYLLYDFDVNNMVTAGR